MKPTKFHFKMLTPTQFTARTRKAGCYAQGIGPDAVRDLIAIIKKPEPMNPQQDWRDRAQAPSFCKNMGKLIKAGFVQLNRPAMQYEATGAGREHINRLRSEHLIR